MEDDIEDIFFHYSDIVSPHITSNYLKTYKLGTQIEMRFKIMSYYGKHNYSLKACNLEII